MLVILNLILQNQELPSFHTENDNCVLDIKSLTNVESHKKKSLYISVAYSDYLKMLNEYVREIDIMVRPYVCRTFEPEPESAVI